MTERPHEAQPGGLERQADELAELELDELDEALCAFSEGRSMYDPDVGDGGDDGPAF